MTLENRAHDVACSACGAEPGQWCSLTAGVRTWAIVHNERAREAEFAEAFAKERAR